MENQLNLAAVSEDKFAALEARLEAMEKEIESLRKWRRSLREGTEFLNLGILHVQGIEMQYEGKRRGWLMATEEGAKFCLYDGDEQMRVNISVDSSDEDGTILQLLANKSDENEKTRNENGSSNMRQRPEVLRLGAGPDGGLMVLFDAQGQPRVVSRGLSSGGSVAATNKSGQALAVLKSDDSGGGLSLFPDTWEAAQLRDTTPSMGIRMEATPEGSNLVVREESGALMALVTRDKSAVFMVNDENDCQRISLAAIPQMTALRMHHNDDSHRILVSAMPNSASVSLQNEAGETLGDWTLTGETGMEATPQCSFNLGDTRENRRISLLATDNLASIKMCDGSDHDRISLLVSEETGALRISDQSGVERLLIQDDPTFLIRDQESRVVGLFDTSSGGRLSLYAPPSPDENLDGDLELLDENDVAAETASGTAAVFQRGIGFLHGPATRQRVILAANPAGAGLVLHGGKSEEQMLLSVGETASFLQIKDHDGTPHLDLRTGDEGGRVTILNDAGAPRAYLGIHENLGSIALLRSDGTLDAILHANEDGGQLQLFDEYGECSATLP